MRSARTSISMGHELYARAVARQQELGYSTFSDYIQALIRADSLQRGGHLREPAGEYRVSSSSPSERPVEEVASDLGKSAVAEVSQRKPVIGAPNDRKAGRARSSPANPSHQPAPPKPAPK